jgi:hypothetical protein
MMRARHDEMKGSARNFGGAPARGASHMGLPPVPTRLHPGRALRAPLDGSGAR